VQHGLAEPEPLTSPFEGYLRGEEDRAVELERLNRWLSLAANLGLLAGLILVAYEINQNSQLARAQLVNEGNLATNELWAHLMGENPVESIAKSIEEPTSMSYGEFMAVDAALYTSLNLSYRNYQLAQEGVFEETDWKQSVEAYAAWFLANPFGRAWWDVEAREFFAPEFSAYVDAQLDQPGARDSEAYFREIQARLKGR